MTQLQKHKQKSSKIRFAGLKCLVCLVLRSLVQLEHLAVLIKTASEMHVALWIVVHCGLLGWGVKVKNCQMDK